MLNLLLRSTTKEHFIKWEKNQLTSDVISTLLYKYCLFKLIARHRIINKSIFGFNLSTLSLNLSQLTFVMVVLLDPVLLVLDDRIPVEVLGPGLKLDPPDPQVLARVLEEVKILGVCLCWFRVLLSKSDYGTCLGLWPYHSSIIKITLTRLSEAKIVSK